MQPGLSVIVSAIIGARKIFQRMTTYSKYTVAMTFRICFTFGLLTVLYNFYFPTVLIVLLAVFNDGAMIALSKVQAARINAPCHVYHWSHLIAGCDTLATLIRTITAPSNRHQVMPTSVDPADPSFYVA